MRSLIATIFLCGAANVAGATPTEVQWGQDGDVPLPVDFDNDGYADYAVWRPTDGSWWIKSSASGAVLVASQYWGLQGDVPVPADYDGDGQVDFAVWRPSDGYWYVLSGRTYAPIPGAFWGQSGDVPVPGDVDNDGIADRVVWRPSTGEWWVDGSTIGQVHYPVGIGLATPVAGAYDATRGADLTLWRPALPFWDGSRWRVANSRWTSTNAITGLASPVSVGGQLGQFATGAHLCTDTISRTIWNADDGSWTTPGQPTPTLGTWGDVPVPANYAGAWDDEIAVWRPSNGTWYVDASQCDRWQRVRDRAAASVPHVTGIAVAVVKNGQIVVASGAGMANPTTPATADVPWQIASVSKLFIGTALLRAMDEGFPIDPDQPTTLANPINGAMPLLRQFADHTSGVKSQVCYAIGNFDPSPDLQAATSCLSDPSIWNDRAPGTVGEYSNVAASWGARVLETKTGIDFNTFTKTRIFASLGMTSTGWFLSDFPGRQDLAIGYWQGAPSTQTGVTPYAMGNLRSSARDLAKFMLAWTALPPKYPHQPWLSQARKTYAFTVHDPQGNSDGGFYWFRGRTASYHQIWQHGGVMAGICTRLDLDPATRSGVVVLTNGNCADADPEIIAIEDLAFRTADNLP